MTNAAVTRAEPAAGHLTKTEAQFSVPNLMSDEPIQAVIYGAGGGGVTALTEQRAGTKVVTKAALITRTGPLALT